MRQQTLPLLLGTAVLAAACRSEPKPASRDTSPVRSDSAPPKQVAMDSAWTWTIASLKSAAAPRRNDPKEFDFNEDVFRGDCMMERGAVAIFNADGTGTFRGRVRSTDDDDTWLMGLEGKAADDRLLFHIPMVIGRPGFFTKDIADPGRWYEWSFSFTYPAAQYGPLQRLTMVAGC